MVLWLISGGGPHVPPQQAKKTQMQEKLGVALLESTLPLKITSDFASFPSTQLSKARFFPLADRGPSLVVTFSSCSVLGRLREADASTCGSAAGGSAGAAFSGAEQRRRGVWPDAGAPGAVKGRPGRSNAGEPHPASAPPPPQSRVLKGAGHRAPSQQRSHGWTCLHHERKGELARYEAKDWRRRRRRRC